MDRGGWNWQYAKYDFYVCIILSIVIIIIPM